ncbi:MAG: hypothetical protein AAF916_08610 [Planctomycetota bacterium]
MALVLITVATLKVRDDQAGTDTLAECVGIVVCTAFVLGVLALAAWHYREQHLLPKMRHYQALRNVSI